jgi:hypothetical protein
MNPFVYLGDPDIQEITFHGIIGSVAIATLIGNGFTILTPRSFA